MSYCVTINSLEHLPAEETLLIHYSITCSGTWYLSQLNTAYRNVCDSGWTVMYPNHQHPRHSDFPITVSQSHPATFAWNYGGIQGIEPENFDENHSYLVQLSIYDYYCLNTGQPPGGGSGAGTTGTTTSGSSTGTTTNPGGGNPPGGGGNPPGVPSTPVPGQISPPLFNLPNPKPVPPGSNEPNVSLPIPAPVPSAGSAPGVSVPPVKPTSPSGPGISTTPGYYGVIPQATGVSTGTPTSGPIGGLGSNPGGAPTPNIGSNVYQKLPPIPQAKPTGEPEPDPGIQPTLIEPRPFVYVEPTISTNVPGVQEPTPTIGTNVTQQNNSTPIVVNRILPLAGQAPGSNPGEPQVNIQTFYPAGSENPLNEEPIGVNYRQVEPLGEGNIIGSLENTLINSSSSSFNPTSNQVSLRNIDQNAIFNVIIANNDVTVGEPIVVSSVFKSPQTINAKIKIEAQDQSRSVLFAETPVLPATEESPLTCGVSINSSVFTSSPVVVTCKALSENGDVIGINSSQVTVSSPRLEGSTFSSKVTQSNEVPDKIIRDGKLSSTGIDLDLRHNSSTFVIVESESAKEEFSTVLQSTDTTKDVYSLSVYNGSNGIDKIISDNFVSEQSELYSQQRYTIDEQEYKPETHTAALPLSNITSTNCLLLEISPSIGNSPEDTKGKLYINSEFNLRAESFVGDAALQTVSGIVPYLNEKYGLVVNGRTQSIVPSNYTENSALSDNLGQVVWTDLSLSTGDYYSIVKAKEGVVNPFITPVYEGRVQ